MNIYLSTDHIFNKIQFKKTGKYKTDEGMEVFNYRIENVANGYSNIIALLVKKFIMSSVLGSKIVAYKIDNVKSAFDYVEGLREPLFQFITNLRRVNFKYDDKMFPFRAKLEIVNAKKGKEITAADIKIDDSGVSVLNPEMVLGYYIGKDLTIDLQIALGFGYITKENHKNFLSSLELDNGWLLMDVLFNPVYFFNYSIRENAILQENNIFYDYIDIEFTCPTYKNSDEIVVQILAMLKNMFNTIYENNKQLVDSKTSNDINNNYNVKDNKENPIEISIDTMEFPAKIKKILVNLSINSVAELTNLDANVLLNEKGMSVSALKEFVKILEANKIQIVNHNLLLEKINE